MKFKVGQEISINTTFTVLSVQEAKKQDMVGTSLGFHLPDYILSALSAKAIDPPAPKEDKPALREVKPAQEAIKLYCVKDDEPGQYLTRGRVYEFDGGLKYDNLNNRVNYTDYKGWKRCNISLSSCLFPLVRRPAKAGEWVLIVHLGCVPKVDGIPDYKLGDLLKITGAGSTYAPDVCGQDRNRYLHQFEYLVLDGYDGRYEEAEKPAPKEMTVAEIEKILGYPVKVVKGE